jgi:hypothetical protein
MIRRLASSRRYCCRSRYGDSFGRALGIPVPFLDADWIRVLPANARAVVLRVLKGELRYLCGLTRQHLNWQATRKFGAFLGGTWFSRARMC